MGTKHIDIQVNLSKRDWLFLIEKGYIDLYLSSKGKKALLDNMGGVRRKNRLER